MLAAFRVDQFAQWILVTALCAYASLALNGLFYALLNEITIAMVDRKRRAESLYGLGMALIAALSLSILTLLFAVWLIGPDRFPASVLPLLSGLLVQALSLSAILFDANFRALGRYQSGTNILTAGRMADWTAGIALAFLLRDVAEVFAALVIYKVAQTAFMFAFFRTIPGALSPISGRPRINDAVQLVGTARGQILLSAYTAAATMGPQIAVSLFYADVVAVAFSIFRTYLRLLAAGVSVLTAASWPLLNEMYARGDFVRMQQFLSKLLARSIGLAAVAGLAMVGVADHVFPILFHGKVKANKIWMCLILASVLINCAIAIYQMVFVSTNIKSPALASCLIVSLASLATIVAGSRVPVFDLVLLSQVGFDICVLIIMALATRTVFANRLHVNADISGDRGASNISVR